MKINLPKLKFNSIIQMLTGSQFEKFPISYLVLVNIKRKEV